MQRHSRWNRRTFFFVPDIANHVPDEVSKLLRNPKPAIVIGSGEGSPDLTKRSFMPQPGEAVTVARQLSHILREHSA